jgi:hypothetical protein
MDQKGYYSSTSLTVDLTKMFWNGAPASIDHDGNPHSLAHAIVASQPHRNVAPMLKQIHMFGEEPNF